MPDTIYLSTPQETQRFLDSLPDSLRANMDEMMAAVPIDKKDVTTPGSIAEVLGYLVCSVLVFFVIVKIIKLLRPPHPSVSDEEITPDEQGSIIYVYDGRKLGINSTDIKKILEKRFSYYGTLLPKLQDVFVIRVGRFMSLKTFIVPKGETFKEVPVLLSASAVQLTFGLDDFELPWFRYIRVHPEEYFANDPHAIRVLAGHVEENTITVAWNHFLKGICDNYDGVNVGLHEMAHALYYQHVIASKKEPFIKELSVVMEESEEIYELKNKYRVLYSDYAYKNLQEFWAESIELFFEKPQALKTCYPDLYKTLCELLNQDTLNKTNPLLTR